MPNTAEDRESRPQVSRLRFFAGVGVIALAALGFVAAKFYLAAHHAGPWAMLAPFLVLCAITFAAVTVRLRYTSPQTASPAAKRYAWRLLAALMLYCVVLLVVLTISNSAHPAGALAYALAVAPALPLLAVFTIMALHLHGEPDEFQRLVFVESALWATGLTLAVATVWGVLEAFHLVPHVESWVAFPLWVALNTPPGMIIRWRYR